MHVCSGNVGDNKYSGLADVEAYSRHVYDNTTQMSYTKIAERQRLQDVHRTANKGPVFA